MLSLLRFRKNRQDTLIESDRAKLHEKLTEADKTRRSELVTRQEAEAQRLKRHRKKESARSGGNPAHTAVRNRSDDEPAVDFLSVRDFLKAPAAEEPVEGERTAVAPVAKDRRKTESSTVS